MNSKMPGESKFMGTQTPDNLDSLLVADLIKYLSDLGKLHGDRKTGNVWLSYALHVLAQALSAHSSFPVSELPSLLGQPARGHRRKTTSAKVALSLPEQLSEVDHHNLEMILDNPNYTKAQIVEIGSSRFGISRSKLPAAPQI